MSSYFVLTEEGVEVVEAQTVDESHPFELHFVSGGKTVAFDHNAVLWWSAVEPVTMPFPPFPSHRPPHGLNLHGGAGSFHSQGKPAHAFGAGIARPEQSPDFIRRSGAALMALVRTVMACVPRNWKTATLELDVAREFVCGPTRVKHRIRNADTGAEVMDFSDAMFATIEVFQRISAEQGQNWARCTVAIQFDEHGRVTEYVTNFKYDPRFA